MRFSIAIFATLALSMFTSATPVVVRDASVEGAQSILLNLQAAVKPIVTKLASIQPNVNATSAVVKPLIDELTTAISAATTKAVALKGQPQSIVLSSATASNETVPLQTISQLVADILSLVILALANLFQILGPGGILVSIIPPVGIAISNFVGALLLATEGLVIVLKPLVAGILDGVSTLVTSLGLAPLVVALGL